MMSSKSQKTSTPKKAVGFQMSEDKYTYIQDECKKLEIPLSQLARRGIFLALNELKQLREVR